MTIRFLVTGGAGFIGSNIAEFLLKKGYKVRILDNFSTGKLEHIKPFINKLEVVRGDIRKDRDLSKALKNVDYVLHQAALRSVPRSVDDPLSTNEVNITGTLKLLMASKKAKVKRLVYASSSSVYGDAKTFPQNETHATAPVSPYATSKLAAENYCRVFSKTYGFETVSLRYFNVFGPRQDPESKYSAVIPIFMEAALNGKPMIIHGDGRQSRDFTYIDNVVDANIKAALTGNVSGEVFNIACNETHSVMDIARCVAVFTGKKPVISHTAPRKGDVRQTRADISKAMRLLQYRPLVSFEEGLEYTFQRFINNNK